MTDKMKDCPVCYGRGTRQETRTETDTTMSVVMGSALGMGYFPMTKTVTETVPCYRCHGRGEVRA